MARCRDLSKWGHRQGKASRLSPWPAGLGRERGSWAPRPGSSNQVTSRPGHTLEDIWYRGRGLALRPWDAGQRRKFCTGLRAVPKPAVCQRSSSSATPVHRASFTRSAGFRVLRLSVCWARACAQEAAPEHNAMQSGHRAFAAGPARLVLRAAFRSRCGECGRHRADEMGPQRGSRLGQEGQQIWGLASRKWFGGVASL